VHAFLGVTGKPLEQSWRLDIARCKNLPFQKVFNKDDRQQAIVSHIAVRW